ncbi:MAG TPA: tetratricopeptide repeat protein [Flavobacterium sp.]|jgi:tetratricopeptide (TPR) repeat protein
MKRYLLLILLLPCLAFGQTELSDVTFDNLFYKGLNKWVAFPKAEKDSIYLYGFIYLDHTAGFTFGYEGHFTVGPDGTFIASPVNQQSRIISRLDPQKQNLVAILPAERQKQLGVPSEPDWLVNYRHESELADATATGSSLNHIGASEDALFYLEPAYQKEPHYKGLEFEIAYAYNALGRYDDAVNVLIAALPHDRKNHLLYKELVFAYASLAQLDKAEIVAKKSIDVCEEERTKSEIAVNMAQSYYTLKDRQKFKKWTSIARQHTKPGSEYSKYVDFFESELKK